MAIHVIPFRDTIQRVQRTLLAIFILVSLAVVCSSQDEAQPCAFSTSGEVSSGVDERHECEYTADLSKVIRVFTHSSEARREYPVLFVVRQQKSVLSWAVPYIIQQQYVYYDVGHTLCPEASVLGNKTQHNIVIDVTTASQANVSYSLTVSTVDDFQMGTGIARDIVVNPSEPQYYLYQFPVDVQSVMVKAKSNNSMCAQVSIQEVQCPVYDQQRNVEFVGTHQTMTTQAAITVQRDAFRNNSFFVVLVVLPNDECTGESIEPIYNLTSGPLKDDIDGRDKLITLVIEESLPEEEFWKPILLTIGVMLCFYLVAAFAVFIFYKRNEDKGESGSPEEEVRFVGPDIRDDASPLAGSQKSYGTTDEEGAAKEAVGKLNGTDDNRGAIQTSDEDSTSSLEGDIDMLERICQWGRRT